MSILVSSIIILVILFFTLKTTYSLFLLEKRTYFKIFLVALPIAHLFFTLCNYRWNLNQEIDAYRFYYDAKLSERWLDLLGLGSDFLKFAIYPLVKIGVNYFTLYILFSYLSLLGFYNYYKCIRSLNFNYVWIKISLLFLLLPSLHFWTGSLGKDAVIFYLMSGILINIKSNKLRSIKNILFFFLIAVIRPHIFAVLLLAVFIILIKEKKLKPLHYIVIFVIGILNYFSLLYFAKIPSLTVENLSNKLKKFNEYGMLHGNSHIDLFDTNYFERIFALLYRPLFIDSNGLYQFLVSLENLITLVFSCFVIFKIKKLSPIKEWSLDVKFAFISAILITLLISIYIYNLGLASRMRVMIIPYILYVIFHSSPPITMKK